MIQMSEESRNRRDRKSKTSPLMNADDADQKKDRRLYRGFTRMSADQGIARNTKIAKDRRNWKAKPLKHRGTEEAEELGNCRKCQNWQRSPKLQRQNPITEPLQ
jgi:hypothetical protein